MPAEPPDRSPRPAPRWETVLAAAARLQELVPDAVLVGGTAAAHHAGHRVSFDDDHVLTDLKERFEQVLGDLEDTQGWVTARVRPPVLILGSLEGVETGIRQLVRRRPLETEEVQVAAGGIRVPTLEEMTRIKGWLVLQRNATRDYLDFVALAERLGAAAVNVVLGLDDYYADQRGPGGQRIATQLAKQLAQPAPYDRSDVDLRHYRQLQAKWQDWAAVDAACRAIAGALLSAVAATDHDADHDAGDDAGPRGQHRDLAE